MASRDELNARRANAIKRTRDAGKKISRLKATREVNIAGTTHDPRKPASEVGKMNSRQLATYEKKVESFLSRGTQFAAGARGGILSGSKLQSYNQLQRQLNKDKKAALAQIQNLFIASAGMTIGERVEAFTPKHPVTAAPSSYAPHIPFTKSSKAFPNDKELGKAIKQMKKDQDGGYFDRKYKSQRKAADQMIHGKEGIRNSALTKEYKDLNPTEFSILWNYTNFAEVTSTDYVIRKSMYHDKKELAWYDISLDSQLREARKRIGEIKALKLGGRL